MLAELARQTGELSRRAQALAESGGSLHPLESRALEQDLDRTGWLWGLFSARDGAALRHAPMGGRWALELSRAAVAAQGIGPLGLNRLPAFQLASQPGSKLARLLALLAWSCAQTARAKVDVGLVHASDGWTFVFRCDRADRVASALPAFTRILPAGARLVAGDGGPTLRVPSPWLRSCGVES
jgi:hypothetical protein